LFALHLAPLAFQLYLTPFVPSVHVSFQEPSQNKTPNFALEKQKDLQRKRNH
jgi:hypothetical protein